MSVTGITRFLGMGRNTLLYGALLLLVAFTIVQLVRFSQADTGTIRPDGDGSISGTPTGCGGGGNYDCLNDVVTQPTLPDTSSDYLTWVNNDTNFSLMQTLSDVNTATSVTVWYYHVEGGANAVQTIGLYAANEFTAYGGPTSITSRSSAQWDSVTFSGLTLTQAQLDDMRVRIACTKVGGGTSNTCTGYALYATVDYSRVIEATVGTTGTQQNIAVGATDAHVGGAFSIVSNVGSRNVTSITVNETGTVNGQTNLDNIRLYYELDTSLPYDCASESYNGTETQYGTTDTDGFSAADGASTFTGSVGITTTATMCVYPVLDVLSSASAAETIELQISNPSTGVVVDGSSDVTPTTAVALSGTTILQKPELRQMHYHWRNDDANEAGASSATAGSEDTTYDAFPKSTTKRLRIEVSNEGNATVESAASILDPFTTGTTKSISAGENRLLLVGIHTEDTNSRVNVTTVTYGGQTLTEVGDMQIGSPFANGMWVGYLDEAGITAASGNTIVASWGAGVPPDTAQLYSSVVFENVDQIDPVPAWSGNTGASVSTIQPTTTIAVSAGDYATYFTVSGSGGQTHTPAANFTEGTEQDSGSVAANAYRAISSGGTEQPIADWTNTQNRLAIVANTVQFGHRYQLEYAQKVTTCGAATGWTDVGAAGGDFDMSGSTFLTDGSDTTNVAIADGGVTNENTTFLTPNGAVLDQRSYTDTIVLTSSEYVEIEYAIESTAGVADGNTYCFRVTNMGEPIDAYTVYPEATILADVTVSSFGSQRVTVDIPTASVYAGAPFVIADNIAGDTTIQSILISASGTVNYQTDISNIELRYDLDTSAPYDCASESYSGAESQFGTTDTNGFSATGTSHFTGSQIINPTQSLCLYTVFDVGSGATNDETLDIKIADASTDVTIDTGSVAPAALVDLSGTTAFVTSSIAQVHYHWRNDNGDETGATSATGGSEDTLRENLRQLTPLRLRIGIANEGSSSTPAHQFRLEYALRTSSCAAATGWTDVGAVDGAFDMFNSANITDGGNTTNIAVANGGVTDVGDTYLTTNGALKDTSSQTGSITLSGKQFVDLEYALVATASSTEGARYCFRATNAGTPLNSYSLYPQAEIKPRTDFFVQRDIETITGTSLTITAGVDYIAPSASSSAFIRITDTLNTGAGTGAAGNADDVTVYISDPGNIGTSVTFTRPSTATGNTRIAWEIIEYTGAAGGDNEIIVREQRTATYATGNTTVNSPTVASIADDNDVAVFITGQLNPDTLTAYPLGNSTAAWNAGSDTATFTRGASGNAAGVSYAIVEFTGANWAVQRSEHTYTVVGSTTPVAISAVNSLSRAFIHTQKRMTSGLNTHGDFGHQVWLSGLGQISYSLDSTASTPSGHTSVAWIIENTQNIGNTMVVTRSNGTQSGGASPTALNVNIGTTIDDTQNASIFMNNFGNEPGGGGGQNSFPEPMMSARIISVTQYELWIADTSDSRSWRTEIVEWPTAARDIEQNYYRFYQHNDAIEPTQPWPCEAGPCGENTEITGLDSPIGTGEVMRIRMSLVISSAAMTPGLDTFRLQFGERTSTCSAITEDDWRDVGEIGSTTAYWRGYNATPTDGDPLSTDPPAVGELKLSVSDVAGTYEEQNDTALTPYEVAPGEDVEFDWVVENNGAPEKKVFCFRMLEAAGTLFDNYFFYPTMRTAGYGVQSQNWRWYDNAELETPTTTLAAENVSPIDVAFDNTIQLRITLREVNGATSADTKFRLEFSESSSFSTSTYVAEVGDCVDGTSYWCYADGAGVDNVAITTATLTDADVCTGGSGAGCGTHNESGTTTSTFTHDPGEAKEFAFTIRNAGARVNRVYYFRVYDVAHDELVALGSGESYPSLTTEGASLVFTVGGLPESTVTEGVTLDISSSPNSVGFGVIPPNTPREGAQRLTVSTNASAGYQILMYTTGTLMSALADTIDAITSSNSTPAAWEVACVSGAYGCYGYHVGDDWLSGLDPSRFSAANTYAAFDTIPEEVAYSTVPVNNDISDMVFKIQITELQEVGQYETGLVYIAIPVF